MAKASNNPAFCDHIITGSAGIPTFMRQPASRDLEGVDAAIIGVPFDGGTVGYRSGSRFGPLKIREASLSIYMGFHRGI